MKESGDVGDGGKDGVTAGQVGGTGCGMRRELMRR